VLVSLEFVRGVTQPYKLFRTNTASEVSPTSSAVIAVLAAVWLFYAVINEAWATTASGVVAFVFCTATAVLVGHLTSVRQVLIPAAVTTASLAAVATVGVLLGLGENVAGALIVGGTFAYGVPRLVTGLRPPPLAGVSMLYLGLNVADAAAFGIYGAVAGLEAYVAYAVIQAASCVPVMIRWRLRPQLRGN
jgi:uncharacterized protein with PQ loop repeat